MERNEIFEKIKGLMLSRIMVTPEAITWDALLKEDLEVDSLDMVELAMMLEDEFQIKVPDDIIADVKTVGDVVGFVETSISVLD
jgi:acyl carrier protein